MKRRKPNSSAFNDLYLAPLERDLREAAAQYGVGTPGYREADMRARMHHGLRLDAEILKQVEAA